VDGGDSARLKQANQKRMGWFAEDDSPAAGKRHMIDRGANLALAHRRRRSAEHDQGDQVAITPGTKNHWTAQVGIEPRLRSSTIEASACIPGRRRAVQHLRLVVSANFDAPGSRIPHTSAVWSCYVQYHLHGSGLPCAATRETGVHRTPSPGRRGRSGGAPLPGQGVGTHIEVALPRSVRQSRASPANLIVENRHRHAESPAFAAYPKIHLDHRVRRG